MKPRDFLNFFKTKSGKLVLFIVIFGGGLILFSVFRDRHRNSDDIAVTSAHANITDKAQVVQSVELPMQPFHPPTPKPEPLPVVRTNAAPNVILERQPSEGNAPALAPISLFGDAATENSGKKNISSIYAPFGRLISCETIITVDSASIQIGRAHV